MEDLGDSGLDRFTELEKLAARLCMWVTRACSARRSLRTMVVGRSGQRLPQRLDRLPCLGKLWSYREVIVLEPVRLVRRALGVGTRRISAISAGSPEAVTGAVSLVTDRRNRPIVIWWMNS